MCDAGADPGFGRGGPASEAEICRHSGMESHKKSEQSGVQGKVKGLEDFGVLMLKYAFCHILETLSLIFAVYAMYVSM